MCGYVFEENIDYIKVTQKKVTLNNEGKNRAYNEDDYITTTDMAKDFGMSARKLNGILNKEGIQYKQGGQWWHRCILSIRPPKRFL